MDKSVKWQDSSPPNYSDSPSLSDKKPESSDTLKRKKSNIFTKIRKSILAIGSKDTAADVDDKRSLKRALSMDAGLQNRISQLSSTFPTEKAAVNDSSEGDGDIQSIPSKSRIRRSKSLLSTIKEPIVNSGIGSIMQSPKTTNSTNDSILEACESFNTPNTVSLLNTIETSHVASAHQVFNCSWLAPTRKSQLFPGTLSLLPKSATIQFNYQHFNRTISLKLHFNDILNISHGTWNDKRNQALIIDLIRGKRKTWVFVAWTDDHFQRALDTLVQAWRLNCLNKIKSRIDRRQAHLNMKYFRLVKEADKAHESTIIRWNLGSICDIFSFKSSDSSDGLITNLKKFPDHELKNVLFESEIPFVIPQILSAILTEQATNFMTNFRALQGIILTNDSGWDHKTESRTFVTIEDSNRKKLKWKVKQEIKVNAPEMVLIEITLKSTELESIFFKIYYQITSEPTENDIFTSDYTSKIKITGQIDSEDCDADATLLQNFEDEICAHFRKNYFPSLFHLLEAFINESEREYYQDTDAFETKTVESHYLSIVDLYFTTVMIPLLYKLVHFKEFKNLRLLLISCIFIYILRISLLNFIELFDKPLVNVEGQFEGLLKDLTADALESGAPIHSLKLKYQQ